MAKGQTALARKPNSKRELAPQVIPPRELQYRQISDGWTPDLVKTAYAGAEGGSLMLLADLCESIMTDDRINGVLKTRTHGLLGCPLHFKGGTEQQRIDLLGQEGDDGVWEDMADEGELVKLLSWGIVLGVGLAQIIPNPRLVGDDQTYRLETWSPRWLWYDAMANNGYTWRINTRKGTIPIVPGVGWIIFTPYGTKRPWAAGEWRTLGFPWLLKHFALEDRANHSEVMGTPTKKGTAPQGATEGQRNKFQGQIASLGRNGVLVLPEGWDYGVVEAQGRTWEIYSEGIAWSDLAMTITLAGQVVTTEGSPGFSSGNVQDQIKGDLIRFDGKTLGKCLGKQYLGPWSFANTGTYAAPRPCWNTEKPVNLLNFATAAQTMGTAIGIINQNVAVDNIRVDSKTTLDKFQIAYLPGAAPPPVTVTQSNTRPGISAYEPALP